jgi:peptide-methionine (S)-S-oxide reductase
MISVDDICGWWPGAEETMEKATFGAGCFWGVEAAFRAVDGVTETCVGYAGGDTVHPTYRDVCSGQTGHAEVVQATFDPARVSYDQLLNLFWDIHDPTSVNCQGPDYGTQYRSVIFCHDAAQEAAAKASKERLAASGRLRQPIATEILPAPVFTLAETDHQQYLEKRGIAGRRHR